MTSYLPSVSMRSLILTVARDFAVEAGVMTPDTEKSCPIEGAPESTGLVVPKVVFACATAGSAASSESASVARRTNFEMLAHAIPPVTVDATAQMPCLSGTHSYIGRKPSEQREGATSWARRWDRSSDAAQCPAYAARCGRPGI